MKKQTNHELKLFVFTRAFEEAKEIEFNKEWQGATGYYDPLCDPMKIKDFPEGEMFKCLDDHGRRIVIVGTYFGPVVVFDRFSGGNTDGVFVYNQHTYLARTGFISNNGAMDLHSMQDIFGHNDHNEPVNIGTKIKRMHEMSDKVAIERVQAGINKHRASRLRDSRDIGALAIEKP